MAARADPMSQSSCRQRTSGQRASIQRRARPVCKTMPPQLWVMNVSAVGWTRSASDGAGGGESAEVWRGGQQDLGQLRSAEGGPGEDVYRHRTIHT